MPATPVTAPDEIAVRGMVLNTQPVDAERNLWTVRLTLPPGAGLPFWTRPGPTVVYVESGVLGFTAVTGAVDLTLGQFPVEHRRNVRGVEYLLNPGETASFGPGVQQSIRNPVTRETSIVVTMISPRSETPFSGLWTSEGYPVIVE